MAQRPRRLFTVVPRIGLQLGTWAGNLHTEIRDEYGDYYVDVNSKVDAARNVGAVLGLELFFVCASDFAWERACWLCPR